MHKSFSIYSWMTTDHKCLKVVHLFVAHSLLLMTYLWRQLIPIGLYANDGNNTKDKYLIKSLRENKKYGAKWLLKLFPNKNWSIDGLKALIEKIDNTCTVWTVQVNHTQYVKQQTVPVLSVFFISPFSPSRLQFLLENI